MPEFIRRTLDVTTPNGKGSVAMVEFGNPDRPIDVLFSHANGFNAFTYRQILAPLGGEMRIVAYDLRGHGRTTLPIPAGERTDWRDLGEDLVAVMRALGLERPVVLAGHSFGATVSLMAEKALPDQVKALALFDPVLFPTRPGARAAESPLVVRTLKRRFEFESREAALSKWIGHGAFATWPEAMVMDFAVDGLVEADHGVRLSCPREWEASSYMAQGQNGVELLLTAQRPTRVLRAEQFSTCSVEPGDPALAANPLIRLQQIPGTTHFLPMERVDLVREVLRESVAL